MIHVVTAENRHLYSRQLWEMFKTRKRHYVDERGWGELWQFSGAELDDSDDERAAYLMDLGPDEELCGFVRIRPTDDHSILVDKFPYLVDPGLLPLKGPKTWEGARIWVDGAVRNAHSGMHRLLTACAEHILAAGGTRLLAFVDVHNFPHIADGALEFTMTGPPAAYRYGVMVGVKHELSEEAVGRMRDSLGEPGPLTYVVDDEDIARHGRLARVQEEVDLARDADLGTAKVDFATPAKTKARINALYAQHDAAAFAPPAEATGVVVSFTADARRIK
jgi:N-acyl-L-homoserine lactone synthetase